MKLTNFQILRHIFPLISLDKIRNYEKFVKANKVINNKKVREDWEFVSDEILKTRDVEK